MNPCKCGAALPDKDGNAYQIGNGPPMCKPCLDRINQTEARERQRAAERHWAAVEVQWLAGLE